MKILVVGTQEPYAKIFNSGLVNAGYAADFLTTPETAPRFLRINNDSYDLVIIDCIALGKHGLTLCRKLREGGTQLPILTLIDSVPEAAIACLDNGADDCLVYPIPFRELLARIRALLRRPRVTFSERLTVGRLEIDTATRQVLSDGIEIQLTLKEYCLLEYFMRHPNQVLTRDQIIDHTWEIGFDAFSNIVDVHIKNLRKKLKSSHQTKVFETVRGIGYRLRAEL